MQQKRKKLMEKFKGNSIKKQQNSNFIIITVWKVQTKNSINMIIIATASKK